MIDQIDELPDMPIARCSEYGQVPICPSFQGLLVFQGKKRHTDKFSKLEESNRVKQTGAKCKSAQQSYKVLDAIIDVEVGRRARGFSMYVSKVLS